MDATTEFHEAILNHDELFKKSLVKPR